MAYCFPGVLHLSECSFLGNSIFLFSGVACLDWAVREERVSLLVKKEEKNPFGLNKSLI